MNKDRAAQAFATLGHPARLAVLRMLMRFAPQGQKPSQIAAAMDLRANTLSHYLSDLVAAGLIRVQRDGRSLIYSVDLASTSALIDYLAHDVGRGRPDVAQPLDAQCKDAAQGIEYNVLFICSGNSARSLLAEVLLRDLGAGRFRAYSAGVNPKGAPNPFALGVLARNGHDTADLRAKPLAEFQRQDAPVMDFVFTVCDAAAFEDCPPWPGQPITGHWGLPDPARAVGRDAAKALVFAQTYGTLRRRITAFTALPLASLSRLSLQGAVDAIGSAPVPNHQE